MPISRRLASSQLHVRVTRALKDEIRALARRRRLGYSQLVRAVLLREVDLAEAESGEVPDESAIREMAILISVELVLKLQEASIPGGVTLSRRLLEDAARAAIARIEEVEARLREDGSE